MFAIPDSSAMDATAYGGGPGTFVSQIATGQPEQIASLVTKRLHEAEQFLKLIQQARAATQQLEKAWSGTASQTAVKKMTDTLDSFEKMVQVVETTAQMPPEHGANTEEVLLELGYSWEEIGSLREFGAV